MAKGTPQEVAARWAQRTSAATTDWTAGVQRVTESPSAKAAAKADKWLMALQESKQKFINNAGAVTVEAWRTATVAASARLADGVNRKQGKMAAFMTEFLPYVEQVRQQVNSMPDDTFEQRLQKMITNARGLRNFRRGGR